VRLPALDADVIATPLMILPFDIEDANDENMDEKQKAAFETQLQQCKCVCACVCEL
jgi:hypothetical protein